MGGGGGRRVACAATSTAAANAHGRSTLRLASATSTLMVLPCSSSPECSRAAATPAADSNSTKPIPDGSPVALFLGNRTESTRAPVASSKKAWSSSSVTSNGRLPTKAEVAVGSGPRLWEGSSPKSEACAGERHKGTSFSHERRWKCCPARTRLTCPLHRGPSRGRGSGTRPSSAVGACEAAPPHRMRPSRAARAATVAWRAAPRGP